MVCDKDQNRVSFCEDWEFIRLRLAVKEGWLTSFIRKMPIPMKKEHLHYNSFMGCGWNPVGFSGSRKGSYPKLI